MALQAIIKSEKLDTKKLVESSWKSIKFTADKEDTKFNCEIGEEYNVVICMKDTISNKSKKQYFKGEWFIIPA